MKNNLIKLESEFQLLKQYFKDRTTIEEETLNLICSRFKKLLVNKNKILLNEGDVAKHYFFVNKGALRLFAINKDGQQWTRYFAFEGSFCTALPSLIEQTPAFEYCQAIEQSELLAFSRADFYYLVDTVPQFSAIYRKILEISFITAQKRIYGFQGFDGLEKLKWVMQYNPRLLSRVSNKMAASFLGLAPSTLSRLKSQLF